VPGWGHDPVQNVKGHQQQPKKPRARSSSPSPNLFPSFPSASLIPISLVIPTAAEAANNSTELPTKLPSACVLSSFLFSSSVPLPPPQFLYVSQPGFHSHCYIPTTYICEQRDHIDSKRDALVAPREAEAEPEAVNVEEVKRSPGRIGDGKRSPGRIGDGKRSPARLGDGKRSPARLGDGKRSPGRLGDGKRVFPPDGKREVRCSIPPQTHMAAFLAGWLVGLVD
jgi:hypothetical protein